MFLNAPIANQSKKTDAFSFSKAGARRLGLRWKRRQHAISLGVALICGVGSSGAMGAMSHIADLSIEEIANIRVTSVSKKSEPLADAPASIFVITGEDIRRAGAVNLPEALRLAPNLQVARVDARGYAITARGFNSTLENKLLVLIDGRAVYSPLFSGVFWDSQDVVLEDIERIEVISGPGATLWGANAVNGVINVITRSAADTQGALVSAGGDRDRKTGSVRYGGVLGNDVHYRLYAKYSDNDDLPASNGQNLKTGFNRSQAGFRMDWDQDGTTATAQGDAYQGALHQATTQDIKISGANLLGRYSRKLDDGADLRVQSYIDHTERNQPDAFVERLDTVDVEIQHASRHAAMHTLVIGAGYRFSVDKVQAKRFAFLPAEQSMHWGNLFAQDEVALKDNLRLTVGAKLERNLYTGNEFLPNARLAWKLAENQLLWSSLSRAIRAPSRIDRDLYTPANPLVVNGVPQYTVSGSNFISEVAKVGEVGYRIQPTANLSTSVTAFYASYDKLRTLEPNSAGPGYVFGNLAEGLARGIELSASWQVMQSWRLTGGLVSQRIDSRLKPTSLDVTGTTALANNDPRSYWSLRSSFDISESTEMDISIRHVSSLLLPVVPSYTAMDVRLGWKIRPDLELSLIGQNLLSPSHGEFGAEPRTQYKPSVFTKIVWRI